MQKKEERGMRGGGLTLQELQDHNKNFWEKKNQKKARTGRHNVWRCRPCSALPKSHTLKRGGSQNSDALN